MITTKYQLDKHLQQNFYLYVMDEHYACRQAELHKFFVDYFEEDLYPERQCP